MRSRPIVSGRKSPAALSARLITRLLTGLLLSAAPLAVAQVAAPIAAHATPPASPRASIQDLIEKAVVEMRTDPEASRRDADLAVTLLQKQPDADLQIRARLLVCDYQSERDAAAAQREIVAIAALLPGAKRQGLRAGMLDCQGEIAEITGDTAHARTSYENAVTVAMQTDDEEMLALSLYLRGWLQGLQGEYAAGLTDLRRADTLFEKLAMPLHALTTLDGIATLYDRMGDYEQAKHIYSLALKEQRASNMYREEGVTLHNLGRTHEYLGEWVAAKEAYQEARDIFRRIGYPRGEAYALRGLAMVAEAAAEPAAALDLLAMTGNLQMKTPDARLEAQILAARGSALHQLKRLADSAAALESATNGFRQADSLVELTVAETELAAVLGEMGNWRSAFERLKDARAISDKLHKNQIDQRFENLKVEFDTTAKEKENQDLMRENAQSEKALAQAQSVRRLQAAVIVLTVLLAGLLASLAVYQHGSSLRLRKLAHTDELTGVPNRRAVLAQLEPLLKAGSTPACAILIIDIDHFKSINDQYGHVTGDQVLKVVAERVRQGVKSPAFFGRLGGEEFLIALPAVGLAAALQVAETFRKEIMALDTSRWFADRRHITASIGVATAMPGVETISSMLQRADAALYAAKRNGRNCVRSDPELPAATVDAALRTQDTPQPQAI